MPSEAGTPEGSPPKVDTLVEWSSTGPGLRRRVCRNRPWYGGGRRWRPGALTPTEVLTAWRSGADLVKVFPCTQVGGHRYIRALTRPFPYVPLVAAGGITPLTAEKFIRAGATAIGVGARLIPRAAITRHEREWIPELTRRFVHVVKDAREQRA